MIGRRLKGMQLNDYFTVGLPNRGGMCSHLKRNFRELFSIDPQALWIVGARQP
jgi:hypothetical protein